MSTTPSNTLQMSTLCYLCISENTPADKRGKYLHINCEKCKRAYCDRHASQYVPTYCQPCLEDISVTKQDYTNSGVAITHVYDDKGNPVLDENGKPKTERKYYSTKSKQIIMFGNDWLFSELRWSELTEDQAENVLEYHRAAISYLEQVITSHRIAKAHKLASVKVPVAQRNVTKQKEKREKSLDALAQSMLGNMKASDLQNLIAKLQESVGKK